MTTYESTDGDTGWITLHAARMFATEPEKAGELIRWMCAHAGCSTQELLAAEDRIRTSRRAAR